MDRLAADATRHGRLTLLCAARDEEHNEGQVLADVLRTRVQAPG